MNNNIRVSLEECDNTEYELACNRIKRIFNFVALGFLIVVSTALAVCVIAIFSEITVIMGV